ncbi:HNH endonuclease [archaeon]|nr:HNH endonuclease [archaeon]
MAEFKTWSTFWYQEDYEIVEKGYKNKNTFEDIAKQLNENRKSKITERGQICALRSPGAVAHRLRIMGLISSEEVEEFYKTHRKKKAQKRSKGLDKERKLAFNRDGNKCVICGVEENLEFAHVVAYKDTRTNNHKEAITLCKKHHKMFDKKDKDTTVFIFQKMKEYYPEFENDYLFKYQYFKKYNMDKWCIVRKDMIPGKK